MSVNAIKHLLFKIFAVVYIYCLLYIIKMFNLESIYSSCLLIIMLYRCYSCPTVQTKIEDLH